MTKKRKYKILYKIKLSLNSKWEDLLKLSDEQVDYINLYLKHSSFLEACPGSGKTEVIGIKAAFEISKWKKFNSGIAVVTFTTSAAKELNQRVRKFGAVSTETFPHFIGTFDSWIHNYLLQPFTHYLTGFVGRNGDKSINIVDVESSAGFLFHYDTKIYKDQKPIQIKVTDYYYDYNGVLQVNDEKKEALIKIGRTTAETASFLEKKKAFIKAGFATYSDVEWLCKHLLKKFPFLQEKLAQRFPVIIVDECQDLSNGQLHILELLRSKGTCLNFVGDLNQSIYEFRKVSPQDIAAYIKGNPFTLKKLTNNYRSCQPIVNVSENIIGNTTKIIGHENQACTPPCILWQYDDNTFNELPKRFEDFVVANDLNAKKSVILARGKATLSSLRMQKDKYGYSKSQLFALAFHYWYKANRTTEDVNKSLFYLGRVLCLLAYGGRGDSRNQYCPEIFEKVEWRLYLKQFLLGSKSLYPYEENGTDIIWEKWMPKLKPILVQLWSSLKGDIAQWKDVSAKVRTPDKEGKIPVKNICSDNTVRNIFRTTTIHSVKGETLDAVLLISHDNKKSKGGHFSQWLREGNYDPEHVRFAYVAASRPKYALVIATPQLQTKDLEKLEKIGLINQP